MTTQEAPRPYAPPREFAAAAHVKSLDDYRRLHEQSVADPERFWAAVAQRLHWDKPFGRVLDWNFRTAHIRWFEGGRLNASVNCLDRHVAAGRGERTAIVWEGDDPTQSRALSYRELLAEVCRLANVLKRHGVQQGDRVCIYMPMVPEIAVAMLACARLGAVHSVVFGGFSAQSLHDRILDAGCKVVVTADQGVRGGKAVPLKDTTDQALKGVDCVQRVLVLRRTGAPVDMRAGRDVWWHEETARVDAKCPPASMDAEDPLFILYTSGSTGKPKGVLHTTGGYLTYAAYTHELVFDWRPEDIYWCTADAGWVTGHSYIVYGPLCNGATTLMFEGVPNFPDAGRFWDVVEAQGQHLLHRAHGAAGAHGGGR